MLDGTYTVGLSVHDTHDNAVTQTAGVIVTLVLGFLTATPNRFYPQGAGGHGRTTTISYRWQAEPPARSASWTPRGPW